MSSSVNTIRKAFLLSMAGGAFLAFAGVAFAEGAQPNLDEARRLLNAGKAEQAAELLQKDMLNFAGNADYDYVLGLALYQSGQNGLAMFAFERVLIGNPGNIDARLKAAQITVERGDMAYARELIEPLSVRQLTISQQQELDKIRAAMTVVKKTLAVSGYLLGGIGSDDNVTSGPDAKVLDIPALPKPPAPHMPTELGSASRDRDTVGVAEAGASLSQAVGDETWLTAGGALHKGFNRARKDVTESYVNANLGMITRSGNEYFGAAWMGQRYLVADTVYRNTSGGRFNWTHSFDEQSLLTGYFQQLAFTYPDHVIDNSTRRIVGVTRESATAGDDATSLQYGVYGGREVAQDASKPQFSFHILGASLGGSVALSSDFSLAAGLVYESRKHDSPDPLYLFKSTRSDSVRSVGISADYRMDDHWHFITQYTNLRNASNEALYDYTRNTFMLQLKREFDNGKE